MHEHIARDAENHNKLFIGRLNKMKLEKDQMKRENNQMKQMKLENERLKDVETKNKEEIARLKARCTCQKL